MSPVGWYRGHFATIFENEYYRSKYVFDLETAIKQRDAILALNDRSLVGVRVECLDMLVGADGGAA